MTVDTTDTTHGPKAAPDPTGPALTKTWAAAAGLVSVGAAIGVAELLAVAASWVGLASTATSASPVTALGSTFIQFTPEWLKEFAISIFGTYDKVALKAGMGLTLAVLAVVVGLTSARRIRVGQALLVVLGLIALMAVFTRAQAGLGDLVPTIIGIGIGVLMLPKLFSAGRHQDTPSGRRRFLRQFVGGTGIAVLSGGLSRLLPSAAHAEQSVAAAGQAAAAAVVDKMPPLPSGSSLDIPGIAPFVTPNAQFYRIDTAFVVPRIDATSWRLRIHGMVATEISVGYNDLLAMPLAERMVTLCCVSNEVGGDLISNAVWQGPVIRDLLRQAGPHPDADMVLSMSGDGWTASTPLSVLTDDNRDAIFAVTMNGEVLPFEHGFPVRMVVPGLYGYVSATKWVVDLEVTRFDLKTSYWTDRGWSPSGPVKTASRIDVPASSQQVAAGSAVIAGVAWAQHRGIDQVEVQIDGGDWQPATLSTEVTDDCWRQWSLTWNATPGDHTVSCRATDGTGALQIETPHAVIPDGATGYHSRRFSVV